MTAVLVEEGEEQDKIEDDPRLRTRVITLPSDWDLSEDWKVQDLLDKHKQVKLASDRDVRIIALIGFPFDEGCVRNGGRAGAVSGPQVFRSHMMKTGTVPYPITGCDFRNIVILDCGDIDESLSYDDAHNQLRLMVGALLDQPNLIPFVVGGSNDQSYFNARGLLDHLQRTTSKTTESSVTSSLSSSSTTIPSDNIVGVVNIDAHFDVRPKKHGLEHSGSPFRLLLEDKDFLSNSRNAFIEFAAQSHQCSVRHATWISERSVRTRCVWYDDLKKDLILSPPKKISDTFGDLFKGDKEFSDADSVFVSFDIDSIRQSDCPGVSCPSPIGLTSDDAIEICFYSGMQKKVRLFDMSEFNPKIESYNTGKLVALMFYYFVMGVSMRR